MKNTAPPDRADAGSGTYHVGVRPRDAATLIIVRFDADAPRILMGRRHEAHRFMPGKVVFPGGKVDREDYTLSGIGDLAPKTRELLLARMSGKPSGRRARAIALAAIREAYEETGILVGLTAHKDTILPRSRSWRPFFNHGVVPDVEPLGLIARAITPPGMVRRFDTRFFLAEARSIAGQVAPPSDELEAPDWFTFDEARQSDIPSITGTVLDLAEQRLNELRAGRLRPQAPFLYFRHGRRVVEQISLAPTGKR